MAIQKMTRVEIFLPLRSDLAAYDIVTEWLAEELALTRGGSTLTVPFTGLYSSTTQVGIIQDSVRILFCDFDIDSDDPEQQTQLTTYLGTLYQFLCESLAEEELWVVYHSISRISF